MHNASIYKSILEVSGMNLAECVVITLGFKLN